MHTINIAKSIKLSLNSTSSDNIFLLTNSDSLTNLNPNNRILSRNKFVKNLKAYSNIQSLPEAEIPNFLFEDSETDKLNKVLDIEWGSERKQIGLLLGSDNDWMPIGEISLLNPTGYPYRIHNLLDTITDALAFELSGEINLGIRIDDVGYGLLQLTDTVNIFGSYIEELVIDDSTQPMTNFLQSRQVIDTNSIVVLPENLNRKYVLISNEGESAIHLNFGETSNLSAFSIKPGGWYEFTTATLGYYGAISLISDAINSDVLIGEGT